MSCANSAWRVITLAVCLIAIVVECEFVLAFQGGTGPLVESESRISPVQKPGTQAPGLRTPSMHRPGVVRP